MRFSMIGALIKKYYRLLISVMLVSALGCAVILCLPYACNSLEYTLNRYVSDYKYPDAVYTIETTERDKVLSLENEEGIKSVLPRMCADFVMISPSGRYLSVRAFSYPEEEKKSFYFWDSAENDELYGIFLEKDFAAGNNISPGDKLHIKVGSELMECYVQATVSIPETMSVRPTDDFWDNNTDFGYIYVSDKIIEELSNEPVEALKKELDEKKAELDENENKGEEELSKKKGEIEDAKAELESARSEFEEKKKELDKTVSELEDAQKELEAGRDELTKKKLEILDKQEEGKEALKQLKEAKEDLLSKKELLLAAKSEYEKGLTEYETKKAEYDKNKAAYDEGVKEAARAREALSAANKELIDAKEQLNAAKAALKEIDKGLKKIADAKAELEIYRPELEEAGKLPQDIKIAELAGIEGDIKDLLEAISTYTNFGSSVNISGLKAVLESIGADNEYLNLDSTYYMYLTYNIFGKKVDAKTDEKFFAAVNRYVDAGADIDYTEYVTAKETAKQFDERIKSEDAAGRLDMAGSYVQDMSFDELFASINKILSGAKELEEKSGIKVITLSDMQKAYSSLCETADAKERQVNAQRAEVIKMLSEAGVGENEIDIKLAEIENGIAEVGKKENELKAADTTLENARIQLEEGRKTLEAADTKLKNAKTEIDDNSAKLDAGLKEIDDNITKIESALVEAEEALEAIAEGEKQIEENEKKIKDGFDEINSKVSEGENALSEAEKKIADGEKELSDTEIDIRRQFYEARKEIENAASKIDDFKGYHTLCNQLLICLEDGVDEKAMQARIDEFLKDIEVRQSFFYEDSPVKDRIDNNVGPMKDIVSFLPFVFFAITLVVVFLFMTLIIKQCRKEIGILRALGFSKAKVRGMFCLLNFTVSIPAVLLGTGIGILIARYTVKYFTDYLSVPITCYLYDVRAMIIVGLIVILTGQAATLLGSGMISRIMPSEAMSRTVSEAGTVTPVMEKLTRAASPMSKFSLITLLRNKKRFFFSVICVSATVVLIYSAMSFISSKNLMMHNLFDKSINYDCQIFFDGELSDEMYDEISGLEYVPEACRLDVYTAVIEFAGKKQTERISSLPVGCTLCVALSEDGEVIDIPGEGIVLAKRCAESLGAQIGDTVFADGHEMNVTGISAQAMNPTNYISLEQAEVFEKCEYGSMLLNISEKDENSLLEFLDGREGYMLSTFTRILEDGSKKVFATFDTFAWMIIIFALLIGMQIVINIARTNLFEQKRELCVLRTLGFSKGAISLHWFSQLFFQYICSLIVGLPLGVLLAKEAIGRLRGGGRDFIYAGGLRDYLITAAFVFAFVLLSHLISIRMMNKWDLVESIKDKE